MARKISATLTEGLVVELDTGKHQWIGDEPPEAGGSDTGPNPYDMLLGSLAACSCMTLSMYCKHKGITLRSVKAAYTFEKVKAEEVGIDAKGTVDRIEGQVRIDADVDDAQRKRLEQIAERCPVHRTLQAGARLEDTVTFE